MGGPQCVHGEAKRRRALRGFREGHIRLSSRVISTYIQASDDASSESTLERELAPPLSVRDASPKVLIARARHEPYTREGVLVPDLARWLLGEQGL